METATTTQLAKLNAEIDAITLLIASKEAKWESAADPDTKAVLLASIADLKAEKAARSATRDALALALVAAPAPGKKPPLALYVSPHPPVCERHFILCLFSMPPPSPCLCFVVFFKFRLGVCVVFVGRGVFRLATMRVAYACSDGGCFVCVWVCVCGGEGGLCLCVGCVVCVEGGGQCVFACSCCAVCVCCAVSLSISLCVCVCAFV